MHRRPAGGRLYGLAAALGVRLAPVRRCAVTAALGGRRRVFVTFYLIFKYTIKCRFFEDLERLFISCTGAFRDLWRASWDLRRTSGDLQRASGDLRALPGICGALLVVFGHRGRFF